MLRVSCGWAYTKDANIEGTAWAFGEMKGLQEVGIRWNDWHGEMVAAVCASMPSSVRRFEISIRNCHSDWAIDAESRLTPLTILSLPDHLPTTFADGFIAALENRAHALPNLERVSLKRMESSQTVELVLGQDVLYRPDDPARVRRCLFGLGFRIARERPTTNGRYVTVTEDWEWAPPLLEVSGFAVVEMFVGKGADVP